MQVFRYVISPDAEPDVEDSEVPTSFSFTADVEMVSGAQILGVGLSSKGLTLWALVEPANQATEDRTFFVCGNGVDLPDNIDVINYRDTVKVPGGITAHVFEVVKIPAA